jgi:hypothetical protein
MLKAAEIGGVWPMFRSFPPMQCFKPLSRCIRIKRYVIVFA